MIKVTPAKPEPDAHGQAALLLAESILHALIEAGALTPNEAVETVRIAAEVQEEVADEAGESKHRKHASLALLGRIERSMERIGAPAAHG